MNPYFPVKEEYPSSSYSRSKDDATVMVGPPQPIEALHDAGPPAFLTKTFDMVDDPGTNHMVSWGRGGSSFIGFRKIDPDKWEFENEGFLRGQKDLLKSIRRRKTPSQTPPPSQESLGPCLEVGRFGLDGEVNRLRRDKQVLMMEVVKLRQQQLTTRAYLQATEERLQITEKKQQQMMSFLARAMQNPGFLQQLMQQKEKRKELEEAISRKRRRPVDHPHGGVDVGESSRGSTGMDHVKTEPLEFGDYGYHVTELETLALEVQGYGRARREQEETRNVFEHRVSHDNELDEGFWEELLNERFEGELDIPGPEVTKDEDVNVLADRLGYLGSSPKYRK
ncbi:heat stress transcription factor A-2d-like isoform X2 [Hibiscus syriacus]|uniref:heat stress transcription factor A-2d-like isoform X2 n=1 Tax=Hibiscus syriacus TaxID=106335 RepID=UPI0019243B20|nr:heat stress transcription factor A-2d-like isoform X2 [Hibiscus syriacus]